jgi:hypothetical protein
LIPATFTYPYDIGLRFFQTNVVETKLMAALTEEGRALLINEEQPSGYIASRASFSKKTMPCLQYTLEVVRQI